MKKTIYVIDGSAYIYRAYHAVAPLTTKQGLHTHATLGFVNMVRRLIKDKSPEYLLVAFDSRGPVFRHELYSEYKANRPPMPLDLQEQIPYIKQFVQASGIAMLEESGVEADDIIATVAKKFAGPGVEVVIVSGDKDLLQLVDENVRMLDPMKGKLMDRTAVHEKYNVYPEQLLDTFALIGDSSDNVPGVPGVGPKTAQKLINEYGSLDALYLGVEEMKKSKMKEKIIANRELAFLSRDLIALKCDLPLMGGVESFSYGAGNDEELTALFTELEFSRFLPGEKKAPAKLSTKNFICVESREQFSGMLAELAEASQLAVDCETTSLDARTAELVGISLAISKEKAWYIPLGHRGENGERIESQLDKEMVFTSLQTVLTSSAVRKIGHNLKYDWTVIKMQTGIAMEPLADTMVAAHLLEKGRSLKLDELCAEQGATLTSFEEVVAGDKRSDAFAYVPIDKATAYGCEDVYGALLLWENFAPALAEAGLDLLFYDLEMPVLPVLAAMEIRGIQVSAEVLADLSQDFSKKIEGLEQKVYGEVGHEFNLNSPKQLGVVLFEELGLPHGRKTKTGYSTDVKVMEKLAHTHAVPDLILKYRTLAKLKSTYVDKLMQLRDPQTGRVHTSFNQTVTATGRLSSSNPNMQNIPIRMEEGNRIRQAFVPKDGALFLATDYSQIDLRVLAHYSGDEALVKAFRGGEDIHARTAAELFNVSPLLINAEMRRVAKSINFGIVYGMSAFGLAQQLDIGRKEAQRFIDKYFQLYKGVQQFMVDIVESARSTGYVTTLLGRRRQVVDIHSTNKTKREFAERMAINTPIQGTAADIIKCAMVNLEKRLRGEGLAAKMLLQVHDELVFELPEEELAATQEIVHQEMERAVELAVPLLVHSEVGKSLAK